MQIQVLENKITEKSQDNGDLEEIIGVESPVNFETSINEKGMNIQENKVSEASESNPTSPEKQNIKTGTFSLEGYSDNENIWEKIVSLK
jgi:hypothetical protein